MQTGIAAFPHTMSFAQSSAVGAQSGAKEDAANSLGKFSESQFLTLLVAQLKNQDPLDPQDPTQFVSQLAQLTSLEQLISIKNLMQDLVATGTEQSAEDGANGKKETDQMNIVEETIL